MVIEVQSSKRDSIAITLGVDKSVRGFISVYLQLITTVELPRYLQ
jgi:hypothetical protein